MSCLRSFVEKIVMEKHASHMAGSKHGGAHETSSGQLCPAGYRLKSRNVQWKEGRHRVSGPLTRAEAVIPVKSKGVLKEGPQAPRLPRLVLGPPYLFRGSRIGHCRCCRRCDGRDVCAGSRGIHRRRSASVSRRCHQCYLTALRLQAQQSFCRLVTTQIGSQRNKTALTLHTHATNSRKVC